jgi:hypothetical protein
LNNAADQLARLAAATEDELDSSREQIRLVPESSIAPAREITQVEVKPDWAESIIRFLEDGSLPEDQKEAKKIRVKAARYTILQGTLYRRGQTLPLLKIDLIILNLVLMPKKIDGGTTTILFFLKSFFT